MWFVLCVSDLIDGSSGAPSTAPRRRAPSSTRWPTRCSCSARCSPSSPARCSGSLPVAIIAGREVRHQRLPHVRRGEGCQRAGQQARQVEDVRAAARRGLRAVAVVRGRREVAVGVAAVDRGRAVARERGPLLLARQARPARRWAPARHRLSDALRRPRGRHRAPARPDRRLELGVDGGAARSARDRLARAGEGRRQRRPHRRPAAAAARRRRRGDRVRRARPDARRPHPRGDRDGDGHDARTRRGGRRCDPRAVRQPRPADARQQPASGAGARRGAIIPQTRGTAPGLVCPVGSTASTGRSTRSCSPCPVCRTRCATCSSGRSCPSCSTARESRG